MHKLLRIAGFVVLTGFAAAAIVYLLELAFIYVMLHYLSF